jgi:hypothetical protein
MRAKRINVVPNDVDRESFRSANKKDVFGFFL